MMSVLGLIVGENTIIKIGEITLYIIKGTLDICYTKV